MVMQDDLCPSAPSAGLPPSGCAGSCTVLLALGTAVCPHLPGDSPEQQPGGAQLYAQHAQPPADPTLKQPLTANNLMPHLAPVPPAWPGHHRQAEMKCPENASWKAVGRPFGTRPLPPPSWQPWSTRAMMPFAALPVCCPLCPGCFQPCRFPTAPATGGYPAVPGSPLLQRRGRDTSPWSH